MVQIIEKYAVAGLDERERGFNRMADVELADAQYRVTFRYESTVVRTASCPNAPEALQELIRLLHSHGYRQLRSRLTFRAGTYLGTQELWTEHPDPASTFAEHGRLYALLRKLTEWVGNRPVSH